ncbi:MAG: hypothetical protein KDK76_05820 [Chlamydiia bacterium]|nr:hypothetical protein [Chlamydiia bacterium]
MTSYINQAITYFENLEHDNYAVMGIAVVPVVNNLFLEVKRNQLEENHPEQLKKIGKTLSYGLRGQVFVHAPLLAKLFIRLSLKNRIKGFVYLTTYLLVSDAHINHVMKKIPEH